MFWDLIFANSCCVLVLKTYPSITFNHKEVIYASYEAYENNYPSFQNNFSVNKVPFDDSNSWYDFEQTIPEHYSHNHISVRQFRAGCLLCGK